MSNIYIVNELLPYDTLKFWGYIKLEELYPTVWDYIGQFSLEVVKFVYVKRGWSDPIIKYCTC
jgi:hypothetical protein